MRHILLLLTILSVGTIYGQDLLPAVQVTESDTIYGVASMNVYSSSEIFEKREKPAYKQTVYWKRYKALKITGWSSFAMGIPAIAIGYLGGYVDDSPSKWNDVKPGWKALFYSGIGLTVVSFPLLATASVCKRKAHQVSLGADYIITPVVVGSNRREVQPALALRFNF